MSRSARVVGILLSGLVVRDGAGAVTTIPWSQIRCISNRVHLSEAARLLSRPTADRLKTHALRWVGQQTINRLRIRAIKRSIRDGTHYRIWRRQPRPDLLGIAFFAIIFVGLAALGFVLMVSQDASSIPSDSSEYANLWTEVRDVTTPGAFGILGLIAALVIGGCIAAVRPAMIGIRTSAKGIAFLYDNGREVYANWTEFFSKKIPLNRLPARTPLENDLAVVFDAAMAVYGTPKGWRSIGSECRRARLVNLAAFGVIWFLIATALFGAQQVPPRHGNTSEPLSPTAILLVSGGFAALFFLLSSFCATVFHGPRNMMQSLIGRRASQQRKRARTKAR